MDSADHHPVLDGLDRITSWVERPLRRASGPDRYNPLPHAGTISVFLLIVVVVTGLYITLFFQYGYEASYDSVLRMEEHPIQRVMRALHRYSSAALVVTAIVHAWRIFVAGRFQVRRRRWRWLTGVAMLLILWPAGVTGYLLVWDSRAGAIGEAIGDTVSVFGFGTALAIRHLYGVTGSSGSTFMVIVWFVHLLLTAVVGWFAVRHLRRSTLAWLPERRWMLAMGGALVVASMLLPVDMLSPADPTRVGVDIPLDPFVLFLLPVLGGSSGWVWLIGLTALAVVVAAIPFLSRRPAPGPVIVIEDNCTGCDLCVVDCPYDALASVARPAARSGSVVAVDAEACTSCGICLGSCAFGALELPLLPASAPAVGDQYLSGGLVVVACDRHHLGAADLAALTSDGDTGATHLPVRCAGVVGPELVADLARRGTERVEVVGCAPGDCRYGVGNTLAQARIAGDHAPHLARVHQSKVGQRWVAPGEIRRWPAGNEPGAADSDDSNRRALVASSAVVILSALAIAAATLAPFRGASDDAVLRVVVDQEPGRGLTGAERFDALVESVVVMLDGEPLADIDVARSGGNAVAAESLDVSPGSRRVQMTVSGDGETVVVFDDTVELTANERINVVIRSPELTAAADEGREVFFARESGCSVCHTVEPGGPTLIGPPLYGVATRAENRVEGLDARTYLWQSILLPDEYVVEGYPAGQMLPIYRERLSQDQLDALLAYLLTLTDDAPANGQDDGEEGDGS